MSTSRAIALIGPEGALSYSVAMSLWWRDRSCRVVDQATALPQASDRCSEMHDGGGPFVALQPVLFQEGEEGGLPEFDLEQDAQQ